MSEQRERTKIAKGIYRDQWGFAVIVNVGLLRRERRFPPNTELKTLKEQRDEMRVALRKVAPTATRGTFAADAQRYLRAVAALPTIKEREKHIALWSAEFGNRARHSIKSDEIAAVLSRWRVAGLAASTVNHRRSALMNLWTVLDTKAAPNPVKSTTKAQEPKPEARAIPFATVERILDALPDVGQGIKGKDRDDRSKTKARLKVLAYTGLPAAQLKALEPRHVDWEGQSIHVAPRRKGRGTDRVSLPISDQALDALHEFDALDCWGSFSNSSMWKTFQRACKTAKVYDVRPYDLRHSFGTKVYAMTGDPLAVQSLLMHSTQKMTERYTKGAIDQRLRLAVGSFSKAVRPAPKRGRKTWQSPTESEKTA